MRVKMVTIIEIIRQQLRRGIALVNIEVIQVHIEELASVQDQIIQIYREAFALPPYCMKEIDIAQFAAYLPHHTHQTGFRCFLAKEDMDGPILGFTYGYRGEAGQWWHDIVAKELGPAAVQEWLTGEFELAELAVRPKMQGKGLGGRLHDTLLQGLPYHAAALSTYQVETAGYRLYQNRGWVTLKQNFLFPGYANPYRIMGLKLMH